MSIVSHCITSLPNGLKVVCVEQPHLHSATVALAVNCGSRHEPTQAWGLTHLLEHMLFRGSARYPTPGRLAQVFEQAGGDLQAATWRDHTNFHTLVHPAHLTEVLTALGDMITRPSFAGLNTERAIVEEELRAELDEFGEDIDLNNLSRSRIWRKHPMGRRIVGSLASLQSFDVAALRRHHAAYYTADNMVLCVAGRISLAEVLRAAQDAFGAIPSAAAKMAACAPPTFSPNDALCVQERAGSQVGMLLSFEALPDTDPRFIAQSLLCSILDDGLSTRLPQALCEKHGLVYELESGLDCYSDCGVFDVEMQVEPSRIERATAVAMQTLATLAAEGVTAQELATAKTRQLRQIEFSYDSTEEMAQRFASLALFNRPLGLHSEIEALQQVTVADVHSVAKHLFCRRAPHATLIGPLQRVGMRQLITLLSGRDIAA